MKKASLVFVILLVAVVFIEGQEEKDRQFVNYQEMRAHIGKLYQQKKFAEAARILEKALTQFPDHLHANTFNLALMYMQVKEYEKAMKALEYGLENGIWFKLYLFRGEDVSINNHIFRFRHV